MRHFRNFLWFAFGFVLISLPLLVFAETTSSTTHWGYSVNNATPSSFPYTSAYLAAVAAADSITINPANTGYTNKGSLPYTNINCSSSAFNENSTGQGVYLRMTFSTGAITCQAVSSLKIYKVTGCDSGWTLSGTTCSRPDCDAILEHRDSVTGLCVKACPAAGSHGTGDAGYGSSFTAAGAGIPPYLCIAGCQYARAGLSIAAGGYFSTEVGASLGAECGSDTPMSDPADKAADCVSKGQGFGTVNGVVVCSGAGGTPSQPVTLEKDKREEVTNPDGTKGQTDTKEKTTCDGTMCTTEKEVVNGGGGAGGSGGTGTAPDGTTTQTTSQPQSEFCKANPSDVRCQAYKPKTDVTDECIEHPDRVGCLTLGTTPGLADPITKQVGNQNFSPVNVGGGVGSCPGDVSLPAGAVFSWKYPCDMAAALRPFLLALAYLAAGYILMGSFVKKG